MGECKALVFGNLPDCVLVVSEDAKRVVLFRFPGDGRQLLTDIQAFEMLINMKLDYDPLKAFVRRAGGEETAMTEEFFGQVVYALVDHIKQMGAPVAQP